MNKINFYSHLNKEDKIPFNMYETAKGISELNYGDRRMLVAILKVRKDKEKINGSDSSIVNSEAYFTKKLEELLESDFY